MRTWRAHAPAEAVIGAPILVTDVDRAGELVPLTVRAHAGDEPGETPYLLVEDTGAPVIRLAAEQARELAWRLLEAADLAAHGGP